MNAEDAEIRAKISKDLDALVGQWASLNEVWKRKLHILSNKVRDGV
tara:strand:- start:1302 stop:1439 length:138 start_codon:yes stop_codon:yes gene_type:complete